MTTATSRSPLCIQCHTARALIIRPKNHQRLCRACFLAIFESEIHDTIVRSNLFPTRGERVAIGASGGKDSTVLAAVLKTLNERYNYGIEFVLLSIDEGIKGYRDDSLETVKQNALEYGMELCILGYEELYGWTMDQVVEQVGKKGNCTYCGVFRRQALDRGAGILGIKHVVTGHNCDDLAETVLMNLLRGDLPRLGRCTHIMTASTSSQTRRSKPLKYAYEKEIVLYAHHRKLLYFSTECLYSPEAFRGSARTLIKDLERSRPSAILDIVRSGEELATLVPHEIRNKALLNDENESKQGCGSSQSTLALDETTGEYSPELLTLDDVLSPKRSKQKTRTTSILSVSSRASTVSSSQVQKVKPQTFGSCVKCGYLSSQSICKACVLLEGLNKSRPQMEVTIGNDDVASTTLMSAKFRKLGIIGIDV